MNYSYDSKYDQEYFEKYNKTLMKGDKPLYYRLWIRNIHRHKSKGRLLDAGCGQGYFLDYANKYYETYGIDVSFYGIKQAKHISPTSCFQIGAVNNLGYQHQFFDIITGFDILEHLDDPNEALREFHRVLKQDGILALTVPNIDSIGKTWKKNEWFGYRDKTHQNLLTNEEWIAILNRNGFNIMDIFYDGLWDSPYFLKIPRSFQHIFFKIPFSLMFWLDLKFSRKYGENLCIIACKNVGVHQNEL